MLCKHKHPKSSPNKNQALLPLIQRQGYPAGWKRLYLFVSGDRNSSTRHHVRASSPRPHYRSWGYRRSQRSFRAPWRAANYAQASSLVPREEKFSLSVFDLLYSCNSASIFVVHYAHHSSPTAQLQRRGYLLDLSVPVQLEGRMESTRWRTPPPVHRPKEDMDCTIFSDRQCRPLLARIHARFSYCRISKWQVARNGMAGAYLVYGHVGLCKYSHRTWLMVYKSSVAAQRSLWVLGRNILPYFWPSRDISPEVSPSPETPHFEQLLTIPLPRGILDCHYRRDSCQPNIMQPFLRGDVSKFSKRRDW